jgi:hypothetical protein
LAWLPVTDESASTAIAGLEALFRQHRAPLVLKSDNGSAFIAEEFAKFLHGWEVWQLFSPPRMPRYNGSCEAGIGSMKARTHHQAASRGCPGQWACDDVEAARLAANQTARPWGNQGPTPDEVWQFRSAITQDRASFGAVVHHAEVEVRQEQGYPPGSNLDRTAQAALSRVAIRKALIADGLLRVIAREDSGQ